MTDFFTALRDGIAATLRPAMDADAARSVATDALARLEGASVWLAATGDPAPMRRAVTGLRGEAQAMGEKPTRRARPTAG